MIETSKVPQEKVLNHTMVGRVFKGYVTPALYNPHNYRLYFRFTKEGYTPKVGMVGVWFGKFVNYGKEFSAVGEGVRVTVRKEQVEVINKLSEQQWFAINKVSAREELERIIGGIHGKCVAGLRRFVEVYGGSSDFVIVNINKNAPRMMLNTPSDHKVMQTQTVDGLPLNLTFETGVVKKVYGEPNVEYKQAVYAAQFFENEALLDFSPLIVASLDALGSKVVDLAGITQKAVDGALIPLTEQIKLHLEVQKETLAALKDMRSEMKAARIKRLKEEWGW